MAIYKTKTGRYQAVISYRDAEGRPRNKKKTFDLRRDAVEYEYNFNREVAIEEDNKVTYSDVFYKYIEFNKSQANARTISDKISMAKFMWIDLFEKKYEDISKEDFLNVWLKIKARNYSVHRENKYIQLLKAVSTFAYNFMDLDDNTKHLATSRVGYANKRPPTIYTEEQFKRFISFVDTEPLRTLYWLLFYTGLRIGEARALLKKDFDVNTLNINKSIRAVKNGFTKTKNDSSNRVVSLDSVTVELLNSLMNTEGDFLFGGLEPLSMRYVQNNFTNSIKTSGLHTIRIHDLRHSHATMLINRDVNVLAVSKRLGHSSTKTTMDSYAHLLEKTSDQVIDAIENY